MGDEHSVADGYDALTTPHDESVETHRDSTDAKTNQQSADADADQQSTGSAASEPIGSQSADTTANPWGTSAYQRTFAWPATEAMLPTPPGERVVLAGCGCGDHAPWFLDRGASVVGFDVSAAAVAVAHDRHGSTDRRVGASDERADETDERAGETDERASTTDDRARETNETDRDAVFCRGSVTAPPVVNWADTLLCHLVVSHVGDLRAAFDGLHAAARGDATLAVTTVHPQYLAEKLEETDPEPQRFVNDWDGTAIPTYYRPVSAIRSALTATGWQIDRQTEPTPLPAFGESHPERYEAALDRPELLCLRATCEDSAADR